MEEQKQASIHYTCKYVAKCISFEYKYYKNSHNYNFIVHYNDAISPFVVEIEEMYEIIEQYLQNDYDLIRINAGYDQILKLKCHIGDWINYGSLSIINSNENELLNTLDEYVNMINGKLLLHTNSDSVSTL